MKLIKHAAIKMKAFPFCLFVFSQLASVAAAALVALFLFGECCFIPFQYCSKSANICRLLLCCKAMLWTANMLTGFLEGSRDVHGRENPLAEAQHGDSSYFLPHLPLRHCKTCSCTLQELCAHWEAPSQRPGSLLSVGMGGSCLHADFRASRETEVLLNLMTALLYSQDCCSVSRMCGGDTYGVDLAVCSREQRALTLTKTWPVQSYIGAAQLDIHGVYHLGFVFSSTHKVLCNVWVFGTQLSNCV